MHFKSIAAALTVLLALIAPAFAATDQEPPSIIVHGEGRVFVKPDIATIDIGVTSQASSAKEALAANSLQMSALIKTLTAQGIADRDVQTNNFNVSPNYSQSTGNKPPRITGYSVTNSVQAKVRKVSQLGTVLDAVVESGANQVSGINFAVDEPSRALDSVRKQAIDDARRKAVIYAEASGVQLGKVLNVIEAGAQMPIRPMQTRGMFAAANMAAPIASGEEELTVNTTVVFAIQ